MATVTMGNLVKKLRRRAFIEASDEQLDDSILNELLADAATRHNPAYSVSDSASSVPEREALCVIYLAAAESFVMRAAKFATVGNVTGASGYGSDSDTPFRKCQKMAEWFSGDLYAKECSQLGILKGTPGVTVSDTIVRDRVTGIQLPQGKLPRDNGSVTASLVGSQIVDGSLTLNFDLSSVQNVGQIWILVLNHPDEGIRQPWNSNSIPVGGIHADAEALQTLNTTQVKLTGLVANSGDTMRFMVAVVSATSGVCAFSDELSLVVA